MKQDVQLCALGCIDIYLYVFEAKANLHYIFWLKLSKDFMNMHKTP